MTPAGLGGHFRLAAALGLLGDAGGVLSGEDGGAGLGGARGRFDVL